MHENWSKRLISALKRQIYDADSDLPSGPKHRPVLSCVVDTHPKFLMQCWVWLVSAKESGAFTDCDVVVHHIGPSPDMLRKLVGRFGARLHEVELFGEGPARYCNKLQSHNPILKTGAAGAILTDVDLFFLESPYVCWSPEFIQAKIVDHPNPPADILSKLADKLGLEPLQYSGVPTFRTESCTHSLNCNGGLYALPMSALKTLAQPWRNISTQCLSLGNVLGKWLHHSDQIGFLMALAETKLPFRPLALPQNFPTHFAAKAYESVTFDDIQILHYHNKLSPEGRLLPTGHASVDQYIERANGILAKYEHLPEYKLIQPLYAASL